MIEAKNLRIGYEEKIIVNDFSFNVAEGQIVSVIGPNGSGKSTILRCISRYLPPIRGYGTYKEIK